MFYSTELDFKKIEDKNLWEIRHLCYVLILRKPLVFGFERNILCLRAYVEFLLSILNPSEKFCLILS